jgi:hypothetical protein
MAFIPHGGFQSLFFSKAVEVLKMSYVGKANSKLQCGNGILKV